MFMRSRNYLAVSLTATHLFEHATLEFCFRLAEAGDSHLRRYVLHLEAH